MRSSLSLLPRLLVLVVGMLFATSTGCGNDDLQKTIDQLKQQADNLSKAVDAANTLAAVQRGELQKSASQIAELEKQIMAGMCGPMLPFDESKSFDCVDGGKYFPTGNFLISQNLTMQKGYCVMGLKVGGVPDKTSCRALDVGRAEVFKCNDWRCTLKP